MRKRRGAITIIVLLLLGSLAALATGVVIAGSGNLNASFEGVESEKALWAAQAGCAQGLVKLKDDSNWAGFGAFQAIPSSDLEFDVTTYRNPQLTPKGGGIPAGNVYLHAVGRTRTGKTREVGAMVSTSFGALSYAILASSSLLVDGGALVDVRDPATNLVVAGGADVGLTSDTGTMNLLSSTINGNYDLPDVAGAPVTTGSTIAGIRRTVASITYPDVTLPVGADPDSAADATFSGAGPHPPLPPGVYKTLTIDNGAELELLPGEYTVKELIVKNSSILRYRDMVQRCDIFVTTKVEMIDYNIVNDSRIPRNFRVLAEEANSPPVNMIGSTVGYFLVYAPNSDVLIDNGAQIYGAVVGRDVVVKSSSEVHYDPASAAALDMGSGASVTGVRIVSHQFF